MEIHTDQLTQLLREQIEKFDGSVDVAEVGEVLQVGDGVARVSGLENVMSSELVELPNGVFGMALNLEEDNVGLVLFGESSLVKEGDLAKRTERIVEIPVDFLPRKGESKITGNFWRSIKLGCVMIFYILFRWLSSNLNLTNINNHKN